MAHPDHQAVLALIERKKTAPLAIGPDCALIVVDMQRAFVDPDGRFPRLMGILTPDAVDAYWERVAREVVPNARRLISAFRSAALPVAFTGAGTRTGDGADLAGWLRGFDDVARQVMGTPVWPAVTEPDWAMDSSVADRPGEIVVQKTTADPFISTDLADQLRARRVRSVVVCGLTSDVCVAATARGAADRDFEAIVVEDACTTLSEQLHRASLDIIDLAFGRVATTDEVLGALEQRQQAAAELVRTE
jgi:nicotinamidase-related amidase